MKNFKVEVQTSVPSLKDEAIRRSESFHDFKDAYSHYNVLCDLFTLDNAEYSNAVEMNHTAGGVGYDFKVTLICL